MQPKTNRLSHKYAIEYQNKYYNVGEVCGSIPVTMRLWGRTTIQSLQKHPCEGQTTSCALSTKNRLVSYSVINGGWRIMMAT